MRKIKTIVDREPLSSDYIEANQNFGQVLSQVKNLKPPVWKSAWFYGPIGTAVVAVVISVVSFNPTTTIEEEPTTASVVQEIEDRGESLQPTIQLALNNTEKEPSTDPPEPILAPAIEVDEHEADAVIPTPEVIEEPIVEEEVPEPTPVKIKESNILPHIEGVFTGEIPFSTLCHENGIRVNSSLKVVAFNIHYSTGSGTETEQVIGNNIPHNICERIYTYNLNRTVYLTDIKALTLDKKVVTLTHMNLIPYK